jgi:formyltetrahydrofolate hydrolase
MDMPDYEFAERVHTLEVDVAVLKSQHSNLEKKMEQLAIEFAKLSTSVEGMKSSTTAILVTALSSLGIGIFQVALHWSGH